MRQAIRNDDAEDRQVQPDDPCVPVGVRETVSARWQSGDSLWRCPRAKASKGLFNLGQADVVIEWWLLDQNGELIEAFWEI